MHGGTPNTQQGIRIAVDELKDIVTGGRIAALTGHYDMTDLRLADDVNRLLGAHYATIDARRDVLPTIKRGITQYEKQQKFRSTESSIHCMAELFKTTTDRYRQKGFYFT